MSGSGGIMTKKGVISVVLALSAFLLVSSPAARGQVQNSWRKVGALRDARGGEPVRVRVDRAESKVLELTYAMPGLKSARRVAQ